MNKKAIVKTAICRFDSRHKTYEVRSPLLESLMGAGRTEKEAWDSFRIFLNDMYVDYLEGKLVGQYKKRGRPPKANEEWHITVKPVTKKTVASLAKDLGCSQGETVDYLTGFWQASQNTQASATRVPTRHFAGGSNRVRKAT